MELCPSNADRDWFLAPWPADEHARISEYIVIVMGVTPCCCNAAAWPGTPPGRLSGLRSELLSGVKNGAQTERSFPSAHPSRHLVAVCCRGGRLRPCSAQTTLTAAIHTSRREVFLLVERGRTHFGHRSVYGGLRHQPPCPYSLRQSKCVREEVSCSGRGGRPRPWGTQAPLSAAIHTCPDEVCI